jgi:prepilin-type N-terminal cleavage/methylation domain-containing protein
MSIQRKAFTLIELMVTIAIFALIASMSYYSLSASFNNGVVQESHSEELFQLQKTLNFLERDITQTSNQQIDLDQSGLQIVTLQNDQLLAIKYSVNSNQLFRKDITNPSEQRVLGLLDQISSANIKILDQQSRWQSEWNRGSVGPAKAIEIQLNHPYWGNLIKLVMLDE